MNGTKVTGGPINDPAKKANYSAAAHMWLTINNLQSDLLNLFFKKYILASKLVAFKPCMIRPESISAGMGYGYLKIKGAMFAKIFRKDPGEINWCIKTEAKNKSRPDVSGRLLTYRNLQ